MATGITKNIAVEKTEYESGVGYIGLYLKMSITETYDAAANTSTLKFQTLQLKESGGVLYESGFLNGKILLIINGTTYAVVMNAVSSSGIIQVPMDSTQYRNVIDENAGRQNWSTTISNIPHNADGTLSVTVSFEDLTIHTVNGSKISRVKLGSAQAQTFALTAISQSKVHIDNGTSFVAYEIYIDNGSSFDKYAAYIDSGSQWDKCS